MIGCGSKTAPQPKINFGWPSEPKFQPKIQAIFGGPNLVRKL